MRIRFRKGKQKEFIEKVLEATGSPSLRELINRGIDVKYPSLKNYSSERRFLPSQLFEELLNISRLDKNSFSFELLDENFGQVFGGKKSRKK